MPAHQAAGLVGRFQQESGQGLNTKAVGDSGISFGIGQWNRERRANLEKFAQGPNAMGRSVTDPTLQADYALWEMTQGPEKYAGQQLMKARNSQEAATAAMHFERPQGYTRDSPESGHGYDNTVRNANNIMGLLSNPKPSPGQAPTVGPGVTSFAPTVSGLPAPANPNATPTLPAQPNLGWTPLPSSSGAMSPSGFSPTTPTAAAPESEKGFTEKNVSGLLDSLGGLAKGMTGGGKAAVATSDAMQPMSSGFSSEQAARAQAAATMMAQIMQKKGMPKQPGLI
jgi:hypothetical protein